MKHMRIPGEKKRRGKKKKRRGKGVRSDDSKGIER
jgi:hypothetical protein